MIYLGDKPVGLITNSEDDYEWHKPIDWPDLESVSLPGRWDLNTIYFLYDKKCGIDEVGIQGQGMTVYKGTIQNGEFVGEQVGNSNKYLDTLTDEYTIYKVEQTSQTSLSFAVEYKYKPTYPWMKQGCVWIYGELPLQSSVGGNSTASLLTPFMKRINFSHVQTMYFTYPENATSHNGCPWDISVSYVCGNEVPNDWNSIPVNRTGNGPITPPIKSHKDFVLKNVNLANTYNVAPITARNIVLINPSGTMKRQQYQYNTLIEKFVCNGGTLKCTDMTYQFYYAHNLKICDMNAVNFGECTASSGCFTGCSSLETLILNDTWSLPLDLSACSKLTHDSIINLFNVLPVVSSSTKITINAYVKETLTSEEIQIVTDKGWTVA